MIYFVEGESLGPDFGFPRTNIKKHYRWYLSIFINLIQKENEFYYNHSNKIPIGNIYCGFGVKIEEICTSESIARNISNACSCVI